MSRAAVDNVVMGVPVKFVESRSNDQSISQSEPVTPKRRWGYPTDASAVMSILLATFNNGKHQPCSRRCDQGVSFVLKHV